MTFDKAQNREWTAKNNEGKERVAGLEIGCERIPVVLLPEQGVPLSEKEKIVGILSKNTG